MTETRKTAKKNTTWLLLRGLGRDQRHWGDFPKILQQAFPESRVLTPELPGNGSLAHLTSPISIAQATDYYRLWVQEQAVTGPIALIGLSMGGMVALDWCNRFADDIASACVINTSMKGYGLPWQRMRFSAMLRLLLSGCVSKKQQEHQIRLLTTNMQPNPHTLEQQWLAWAKEAQPSLLNLIRQLWAAANFGVANSPQIESFLLVVSAQDRLVNSQASHRIAEHWKLALVEHPTAGHDLPLDAPSWLLDQLIARKNSRKTR